MTTGDTTINTQVYTVGLMNNTLKAMTVLMSVKSVDAINIFPMPDLDSPVLLPIFYVRCWIDPCFHIVRLF